LRHRSGADAHQGRTAGGRQLRITGQKIFISAGDHDMAENIIHLVLAKAPGGGEGIKGISLFIVPKFLVNPDGSLGARNAVSAARSKRRWASTAMPPA
jgi:alkylation response protein AidB-like acyl-CoA dehydrogenase